MRLSKTEAASRERSDAETAATEGAEAAEAACQGTDVHRRRRTLGRVGGVATAGKGLSDTLSWLVVTGRLQ